MWFRSGQLTSAEVDAVNGIRSRYFTLRERGWLAGRPDGRVDPGWYDVMLSSFNRVYSARYAAGAWSFRNEAGKVIELPDGPEFYRPRERGGSTRREQRRAKAVGDALQAKAAGVGK